MPERPVQPTNYRRNGGQSRHAMGCMKLPLLHPAAICRVKRSVSKLIEPGCFNAKLRRNLAVGPTHAASTDRKAEENRQSAETPNSSTSPSWNCHDQGSLSDRSPAEARLATAAPVNCERWLRDRCCLNCRHCSVQSVRRLGATERNRSRGRALRARWRLGLM